MSARLRRIAFKFGNFTATETTLKLNLNATWKRQEDFLLVLDMWERYKNISFLYCCDVIEMIDRTHTKNNYKIEQEQEVNSFFTAMNPQTSSYFHSS